MFANSHADDAISWSRLRSSAIARSVIGMILLSIIAMCSGRVTMRARVPPSFLKQGHAPRQILQSYRNIFSTAQCRLFDLTAVNDVKQSVLFFVKFALRKCFHFHACLLISHMRVYNKTFVGAYLYGIRNFVRTNFILQLRSTLCFL